MASKELNVKVKQRYDTASNWTTNNPVLLAGELGIESDTKKMKVGDGTTSWNSLAYMIATPELPNNIAKTNIDNNFSTNQTIAGNLYLNKINASIDGLLNKEGSGFATTGSFIQVDNTNGAIVIGSEYVSKVKSPNIIQAQGLTDGTTTKTMTEILAGGGQIVLRRWSDDENGWS